LAGPSSSAPAPMSTRFAMVGEERGSEHRLSPLKTAVDQLHRSLEAITEVTVYCPCSSRVKD
jgi:hypothetical protein